MTPSASERGLPEYPEELLQRKDGGRVRVELAFADAQSRPRVRVLEPETFGELTDSVKRHVSALRIPCMPAGAEPVRLVLEFDFTPGDGRRVTSRPPRDLAELERRRQMACMTRITGPARPQYPEDAQRDGLEGNFLMRLRFTSATAPPEHSFVAGPAHRLLRDELARFVQGYRLPCIGGEPVEGEILFHYRIEGGARTLVKDMPLLTLLRAAEHVPRPARFDLDALGCPFDVRVDYYQPHMANVVRELGSSNPARQELLDWMGEIRLRLDAPTALALLGERFTVTVPCGKVDL